MPFGKRIKSGFARALRESVKLLSEMQRRALTTKTVALLELEFCPREAVSSKNYCWPYDFLNQHGMRLPPHAMSLYF